MKPKFRFYQRDAQRMLEVGSLIFHTDDTFIVNDEIPNSEGELMQYTGLKDKNGVECYWDDWVTDGINPRFLVTPDYHLLARLSEIEFEIVGNKYEG